MTGKTLTVRVESDHDFADRVLDTAERADKGELAGSQYGVSLPDDAALARVLSEKNLEIIRTIAREQPASQRELARLIERDIKNVSTAVNELAELGFIKFEQDGRSKRPVVWYDDLVVEYDLGADAGDRDATAHS